MSGSGPWNALIASSDLLPFVGVLEVRADDALRVLRSFRGSFGPASERLEGLFLLGLKHELSRLHQLAASDVASLKPELWQSQPWSS